MPDLSSPFWPYLSALPRPCDFVAESQLNPHQITPGLYMLLDLDGTVLYIGQSCDIARRLDEHRGICSSPFQLYETKTKDFHRAVWYPLADPSERLRTEAILILANTPRYNRAIDLFVSRTAITQRPITAEGTYPSRKRRAAKPAKTPPNVVEGSDGAVEKGHRRRRAGHRVVPAHLHRDLDR